MTTKEKLAEEIKAKVDAEVDRYVESIDLEGCGLDEIERASRQFARVCGGIGLELMTKAVIEGQQRGYVGPSIPTEEGGVAQFERYEERWVQTHLGRIRIERAYYWDGRNGRGRVPLDEKWGLDEREPSSDLRRSIAMVGASNPFGQGRVLMKQLTLLDLPEKRFQESSEAMGDKLRQAAQKEADQAEAMLLDANVGLPETDKAQPQGTLYVQMDGGRLNTTTEGWREPKIGTLFWGNDVVEVSAKRREILKKEYLGTLGDADEFARQLWSVACRWKWWTAQQVVVLGDGAEWIWNRAKDLFPDAIQIIDFYHVTEHIWDVGRKLYGGNGPQKDQGATNVIKLSAKDFKTRQWSRARIDELRRGDIDAIIANLRSRRPRSREAKDAVTKLIAYLDKNRSRMNYPAYKAKGLIVGSGAIESGVKNVVNQRMKGPGMRWAVNRAENMIHLRAAYLSDVGPAHERLVA